MLPRAEIDRQSRAKEALVSRARRDLRRFWGTLDLKNPEAVRGALDDFVPLLTDRYGSAAASLAADYFSHAAQSEGQAARPRTAPPVDHEKVHYQVRRTAGHLWTDSPVGTLTALNSVLDKYVKEPHRKTLIDSAKRSRATWARVPSGSETCAFCLVMASRGFVYSSEQAAGSGNEFHADCDCEIVTSWRKHPELEGYNPDEFSEKYHRARARADTKTLKGHGSAEDDDLSILQTMREMYGLK